MSKLSGIEIDEFTGAILTPGNPNLCQGNGENPDFEICCDECNWFLSCFSYDYTNGIISKIKRIEKK